MQQSTPSTQAQRITAQPSVDAQLALVEAAYGPQPEADRAQVRGVLDGVSRAVAALNAFPLSNADEPAPSFAAYRAD